MLQIGLVCYHKAQLEQLSSQGIHHRHFFTLNLSYYSRKTMSTLGDASNDLRVHKECKSLYPILFCLFRQPLYDHLGPQVSFELSIFHLVC